MKLFKKQWLKNIGTLCAILALFSFAYVYHAPRAKAVDAPVINTPTDGSTIGTLTNAFDVTWPLDGDGGISWLSCYYNLDSAGEVPVDCGTSLYTISMAEGEHLIYFRAFDSFDSSNSNSNTISFTYTVPPVVSITAPTGASTVSNVLWSPSVNWDTATTCEYSFDDTSYVNIVDCSNAGSDISAPTGDGTHTLNIRGTNAGGSNTAGVSFTWDTTAPTFSSASMTDDTLTLTYNEDLDGSTPDVSAFVANNVTQGTTMTFSGVGIVGSTVVLTTTQPPSYSDSLTIDYMPGGSPIQDIAHNSAISLSGEVVGSISIHGCTDSSADNYDPNANIDNGSCIFPGPGIV